MTKFHVSWKSAGKVNFLKAKVIKRRAWKTLNVISTLAIVMNTGMVGVLLPQAASATGTPPYCPSGNPLYMWDRTPSTGWSHGNISGYYDGEYIPVQLELNGLTSGVTTTIRVDHQYIRSSVIGVQTLDHANAPVEPGITFNADRLPFTLGSATVSGSNPSLKTYTLTFTPTGATATLYLDALLGPSAHSYNGASLHVSLPDCGSKDVPISVNQILYHNLEVTKTDNPDPIAVGNNTTYTIKVKNNGNTGGVGEQNVVVTDTLPPQFTYVPTASPAPTTVIGQVLTWNLGTINDGNTKTITFVAKGTVAGSWTNTVNATSTAVTSPVTTPDGSETTKVTGGVCALVVTKEVDKTEAAPGDTLTYTIRYNNTNGTGYCTGGGVHLYDELNGMTYVSGSAILTSIENNTDVNGGAPDAVEVFASTFTGKTTHKELANLHEIGPGEKGVITFQTTINADTQQRCSWTVMNSGWTDGVETQSDVQFQSEPTTVTGNCSTTLTLIKQVTNDNGGDSQPNEFNLSIGGAATLSGVPMTVVANTPYVISESSVDGYTFVSITGDAKCPTYLGGSITLAAGDDITCTITNDDIAPKLTLVKIITNDNGGNTQPNDFNLTIGGNPAVSGTAYPISANTPYTIDETQLPGYTFVSITGNDKRCPAILGGTVTLLEGENVTCTITNTRDTGRLLVKKNVLNPDGSEVADTHEFTVTLDGVNPKTIAEGTSAQYPGLATGTYTVAENADGNYTLDGYDVDTDIGTPGAQITIIKGQTTVLTVTNKQQKATITIHKDVRDFQGNDVIEAANFSVTSNTGDFTIAEFDPEVLSVNPGTYTFTEGVSANYTIHSTNPKEITVGSNGEASYTFVNWQKPSYITGQKFEDHNGNGAKKDAGDQGLANWEICIGAQSCTLTDVNGNYAFGPLAAGTYTVTETQQPGWTQTAPNGSHVVNLGINQTAIDKDFGNFELGRIWGYKTDTLGNFLPEWEICLNGDEECTTTNVNGYYEFTGLSAGDYTVAETLQPFWWAVTPLLTGYPVTINSGDVLEKNFTNFHGVNISGSKFNDIDGNGVWNEGEPGLVDWTIQLLMDDDGFEVAATTTTDVNGNYSFGPLGPGDYRVREVQQGGWTQTTSNPEDFTAVSGQDLKNLNFGNFQYGRISGYKFNDINSNGQWDENEPKLNGWSICLNGTENCVVTGSGEWPTGFYEFTGLTANTYEVYEQGKDGWTQTQPGDEYEVVVTSGTGYGEYQSYDFGNYKYGRISGYKFDWDTENKLDGWTICLVKNQPELDTFVARIVQSENCVVTGAGEWPTGYYEFTGLTVGTYIVSETLQYGWMQDSPNDPDYHTVVVTSGTGYGEYQQYDFWNRKNVFDVSIDKTVDLSVVQAGANLTYTLNWNVTGNTPVEVKLFDALPANTTFVSADNGGFLDGSTVRWNLGTFDPAANGAVHLTVKVNSPLDKGTLISNTANVCGLGAIADGEPFLSDSQDLRRQKCNDDTTTTTVDSEPLLGIAKVANPTTVGGLQDVTYTVTWSVAGNSKATNVVVNDPIPASTTYVSMGCGSTAGTCTMSQTGTPVSSITWNLGTRQPGEGGTLTLVVKTAISVPNGSVIPNKADIRSVEVDPLYAQADVKAATAPQLQITKTTNATIVNPGDPISYTVKVKNIGTDTAINAVMTDTLPAGFSFVSTNPTATSIVGQTGTWNLGNMTVGQEVTITYTVNVAPGTTAGTYDNIAKAKADNATEVSTKVPVQTRVPQVLGETTNPVLQLRKSVSKATVAPGDVITYTVEIKNTGTGSAINVILTDLLPVGFTFDGSTNTTKEWSLGNLAVGETKTVSYKVKVGSSVPNGSYENLAIAQADNHGKVTTSVPVNVKRGRVLAEVVDTGAGPVDLAVAGAGLGLIVLGYVLTRRKRGEALV